MRPSDDGTPDAVHDETDRDELLRSVGEQLMAHRVRRGMPVEAAAEHAGVDAERLAGAEGGELALDEHELSQLADAYEVGVSAFFGGRITPFQYLAGA
jgi:hypothetical protein